MCVTAKALLHSSMMAWSNRKSMEIISKHAKTFKKMGEKPAKTVKNRGKTSKINENGRKSKATPPDLHLPSTGLPRALPGAHGA